MVVRDPRSAHLRALDRARRRARRWIVGASSAVGAAAVALPLGGLTWTDILWAGAAGGAAAIATFRVRDHRELAARPVPAPLPPGQQRGAVETAVRQLAGSSALRLTSRWSARGTPAAALLGRIDRASDALPTVVGKLAGTPADPLTDARAAEGTLRDAAKRLVLVHRAAASAAPAARPQVRAAAANLARRIDEGVTAYEQLVAATAECVAVDSFTDGAVLDRVTEASDTLSARAHSLSELKKLNDSWSDTVPLPADHPRAPDDQRS